MRKNSDGALRITMFFPKFKLYYWPIISSCWCLSSFLITLIISIWKGHVYPLFPYISDTGTRPPESCVFAQLLNIGAILLAICVYLRYEQVKVAISCTDNVLKPSWNIIAMPFGLLACLGISIVGNFQETNIFEAHMIGAFFVFAIGIIYFILQVRITVAFKNLTNSIHRVRRWMAYFRIFIGISLVTSGSSCAVFSGLAIQRFTGDSIEYWTVKDGGFTFRLIGTFSEWTAAFLMMIFVLTFMSEFRSIKFTGMSFESVEYGDK